MSVSFLESNLVKEQSLSAPVLTQRRQFLGCTGLCTGLIKVERLASCSIPPFCLSASSQPVRSILAARKVSDRPAAVDFRLSPRQQTCLICHVKKTESPVGAVSARPARVPRGDRSRPDQTMAPRGLVLAAADDRRRCSPHAGVAGQICRKCSRAAGGDVFHAKSTDCLGKLDPGALRARSRMSW